MKKAKVSCKVKETGGGKVMFDLKVKAPNFGSMDVDLKFDLESDDLAGIVLKHGNTLAAKIDDMDIDNQNYKEYVMAIAAALEALMDDFAAAVG